jgi:hypothetical protein
LPKPKSRKVGRDSCRAWHSSPLRSLFL